MEAGKTTTMNYIRGSNFSRDPFMAGAVEVQVCSGASTFSIWSASRRSLGSVRLGLKVSGSSSALMDGPCLEFTSSLVVI